MWCRQRRTCRRRRPSRSSGSCIRRRKPSRFRTGRKFPISFSPTEMLPAPSLSDLDWRDAESMALAEPFDVARRHLRGVPLPQQTSWLQPSPLASTSAAITLPVPAQDVLRDRGKPARDGAVAASVSLHPEQTASRQCAKAEVEPPVIATNAGDSRLQRSGANSISEAPGSPARPGCRPRHPRRRGGPPGHAATSGPGQEETCDG